MSHKSKKETPVVVTKVESADLDIYYPPKNLEFNHNINDDGVIGIDFKYSSERLGFSILEWRYRDPLHRALVLVMTLKS